nr:hypothetical protein [Tanacetum cinerariifolium]
MTERNGKQMHIYFVSRALQDPEINYTIMEKLILALILTDFIVERPEDDLLDTPMKNKDELLDPWILFTHGSSCIDGVKNLQASVDSKLVANQVNGTYVAKELGMIKYLEKVKNLASAFKEFSIKKVPRGENKKADALSKMTSTSFAHLSKQILVEELKEKSIYEKEKKRGWQELYAARQANYFLREIHVGSYSMHAGPRFVVAKSLRPGYYWPTIHADARKLIRECNICQ